MVIFSLKEDYDLKEDFASVEEGVLKGDYTFRRPLTEDDRVETLYRTILNYYKLKKENPDIQIRRISNPGITDHYCQFIGGGDIFLEKPGESLVIYSGPDLSKDVTLSPTEDTETISCLTIEGKKSDFTDESLLNQLIANTILTCITTFLKNCNQKYNASFIKDVTQISGYGVSYTGIESVGFYKLEIKFDKPIQFQAKFPLAEHQKPHSPAIVDYALDFFMGKITQPQDFQL